MSWLLVQLVLVFVHLYKYCCLEPQNKSFKSKKVRWLCFVVGLLVSFLLRLLLCVIAGALFGWGKQMMEKIPSKIMESFSDYQLLCVSAS